MVSLNELRSAYAQSLAKNDAKMALILCKEIVKEERTSLGPNHPQLIHSLNNLGITHMMTKDFTGAMAALKQALRLHVKVNGERHSDTAKYLLNLGNCFILKKNFKEAEDHLLKALKMEERAGKEQRELVPVLTSLADVYVLRKSFKDAEVAGHRALDILRKLVSAEDPENSIPLLALARVYIAKGDYQKAEPLIMDAIKLVEGDRGLGHPSQGDCLGVLAELYDKTNRVGDAKKVRKRISATRLKP